MEFSAFSMQLRIVLFQWPVGGVPGCSVSYSLSEIQERVQEQEYTGQVIKNENIKSGVLMSDAECSSNRLLSCSPNDTFKHMVSYKRMQYSLNAYKSYL